MGFQSPPLNVEKAKDINQATSNYIYVSDQLFTQFQKSTQKKGTSQEPIYVELMNFVFILARDSALEDNQMIISGVTRSQLKISHTMDHPILKYFDGGSGNYLATKLELKITAPRLKEQVEINEKEIGDAIMEKYRKHIVTHGQEIFYEYKGIDIVITVDKIETAEENDMREFPYGMIFEETDYEIKSRLPLLRIKSKSLKSKNIFSKQFNFSELGVGGMDDQIMVMFRRAFANRRLPAAILEKYNKNHVKGVLLYGPPGTGKTLIAREMAKCLNAKKPKVVNGPELLSKYVGEGEENVRKLFDDARKDQAELGDDSPLHVIIFDEFDALAKPRGMTNDSTGTASNIVNQLLSMIDGVESLNNILVIAMTNRKDLIDPAMLRPGRFEVHIEISLPNTAGRIQILDIHTRSMRKSGVLGKDVDLSWIAEQTKNYTGAELESLVKSANTFALNRQLNLTDFTKEIDFRKECLVEKQDFENALLEVKPDFGVDADKIGQRLRGKFINYGPRFDEIWNQSVNAVQTFSKNNLGVSSMLLYGPSGSGKTTLACQLINQTQIPYAKLLSSEDLITSTDFGKLKIITDTFLNAYRSPISVIVIDEIERIIEYVRLGQRFNNTILQCLLTYIKKVPEKEGHRVIIIGTTSDQHIIEDLGLWECFNLKVQVPVLEASKKEILHALSNYLPDYKSQVAEIEMNANFKLPLKSVNFIADSLGLQLRSNPNLDINKEFFRLYGQISGI